MEIVKPYAMIVGSPQTREEGIALLRDIEFAARISHRSEDKQTDESWDTFITRVVMTMGHVSVIEHKSVTVDVLTDRGITHEIVRHRLSAFTQTSTRYVRYDGGMAVVQPPDIEGDNYKDWMESCEYAETAYIAMRNRGVTAQIARSVLPTCLASRILWTQNLRGWRHTLLLRTSKAAHPQMREIMNPLLKQFQERIPLLFDDIVPDDDPYNAMRKIH